MVRQPKALRTSFRSEEVRALSGTHQEHTKSLQTSHLASCISSPSAVELPQMSGGTCREQISTDASDSSMCGSNCASRPERARSSSRKSHEERVTFRWRRFLLLTYLVVTASTAQLCLMTQDEIRERKLREAQETRNRLRSANQEQQVAEREGKYRNQKPSPTVIPATVDRDLDPSNTTNGRLNNADLGLSASYRTESVSRECIPGMDDVSVMWSTLKSKDGPGRHSGEDGADNRSTSIDTSLSRMCINDATATDDIQNGDILRM